MSDLPTDGEGTVPNPDPEIDDQTPADEPEEELVEEETPEDGEGEGEPPAPSATPQQPRQRGPKGRPYGEELRELRATVESIQRENAVLRAAQQAPRQPSPAELAEQERVYRERFEMLSPWEQHQETVRQAQSLANQQTNATAQIVLDRADKTEFDTRLRNEPRLARYRDEVEKLRQQYPGLSRTEVLLPYVIGQAALNNMGRATTRATTRAEAAVARQGAAPSRAGSDVAGGRQRSGQSVADRLRGVSI